MTARRGVLVVVTVLLVVAAGAGAAVASWQAANTGTATGRAGTLAAPADVQAGTPACSGTTGSVRFSWTAPPGAVSYQVDIATNTAFTTGFQTAATSNPYATVSQTNASTKRTTYFRVRAVAGTWVSANSATTSGAIGPCP